MTKSEFKEKLAHYTNLINAVVALIETFRYYRTKDEFKAYEITKMVTNLLNLDEPDFLEFDEYVKKNWESYYSDDELHEMLNIYGALKAKEVELLEVFKDDNILESDPFNSQ